MSLMLCLSATLMLSSPAAAPVSQPSTIDIASRRELFVDTYLIDRLDGATLQLHEPTDAGPAFAFDRPWEGAFSAYVTILHDTDRYRAYYRGVPVSGQDGNTAEVTCYAESHDGITWTKPDLGLFEVRGTRANNVILAGDPPFSHNFSPLVDNRPAVPASERYKALAGTGATGLVALTSPDAIRWRKLRNQPVLKYDQFAFDSQNVAFWSETEGCYVCYFRTWHQGVRRISRATSSDFLTWSSSVRMEYGDAPIEHLYTNQTHAYFRAPHLYLGIAARFMPGRQVLTEEQARAIHVDPHYFKDCSDAVLLTTRGGNRYDRTFPEAFIRPGVGLENWTSRTNYPAYGVVPTGPAEMSLYIQHHYGQPTHHLRRYRLRTDGFASLHSPYRGGEMTTRPLTFTGRELVLNFATSAAGSIRVEIQDPAGTPLPGYALVNSIELIGNEIERPVAWISGKDVSPLAGRPIRLRFVMRDADVYSLRFED